MSITYVKGDATSPQGTGLKFIVHCCNDAGKWGKGFVRAISKRWKQPEEEYRLSFKIANELINKGIKTPVPGTNLGDLEIIDVEKEVFVCNLIGQRNIYYDSQGFPPVRYDAIDRGLTELGSSILLNFSHYKLDKSVHMPRMGCGLAGGDWRVIEALVNKNLIDKRIPVTVYDL